MRRQRQRMLIPRNEAGGVVALQPTVFRSAQWVLPLQAVRVFSTGVQLQFSMVTRDQGRQESAGGRAPWDEALLGMSHLGDDALWVGVELADGRTATAGGRPPGLDVPADVVTLARTGGRSTDKTASLEYVLAPSLPPGPLRMVVAWPAFGIRESTIVIAGEEMAAAAARTVTLWPAELEDERFKPPRPPQPPTGGWFERNPPST